MILESLKRQASGHAREGLLDQDSETGRPTLTVGDNIPWMGVLG